MPMQIQPKETAQEKGTQEQHPERGTLVILSMHGELCYGMIMEIEKFLPQHPLDWHICQLALLPCGVTGAVWC